VTYDEARKALADRPPSWGDPERNAREAATNEAMAFLFADIAQSLNRIAGTLDEVVLGDGSVNVSRLS
jgi:hypothetical protein